MSRTNPYLEFAHIVTPRTLRKIEMEIGAFNPEKTYAGAGEGWKEKIVPDTIWGISISMSAWVHDGLYSEGGEEKDRELADEIFYECMMTQIRKATWKYSPRRLLAWRRARKYYFAVRIFGKKSFNYH